MKYLSATEIAAACQDLDGRTNRQAINKMFMEQDDSHLWPINNKFNVTKRAIKMAQRWQKESGVELVGLEYAMFIDAEITRIVNNESNW